ncbi:MAG TPA: lytic transglycosylase domain-containing protein [Allosphingosinicella sp.]|nr:lytic transglycosylase domain-containing protein [Allosphingosinicella sp.]
MKLLRALLLAASALPAAPLLAADASPTLAREQRRPAVLSPAERSAYREVFAAIATGDWPAAAARLDAAPRGPLHAVARAELYLAKGSPVVTLEQLTALLAEAPHLPQAAQLVRLAEKRGATAETMPAIPPAQPLVWAGGQPRRSRAASVKGDIAAAELEPLIQPLIVEDRPADAEAYLIARQYELTPQARTELQQRIAWSYYLTGRNAEARRLADAARSGTGEWALHAAWVSGLASWRTRDCKAAADAFATVGGRSSDAELASAGHYWAARADMMCGRPERVQARLRAAARLKETFYGLIAADALGIKTGNFAGLHDYRDAEWRAIAGKPNVKAAIALTEIGQNALADDHIKHQARIGSRSDHHALIHLASDLDLASTQFWLAHNAPRGTHVNLAARYPSPDWRPTRGWRVDRSLAFAHALQESNFRTAVVSPAGARGVMQVRPGTAGDIARKRGEPFDPNQLSEPAANLEYGQSYLEYLRSHHGTGGLLPKVIAAYNAGPLPIAEWNMRRIDQGDPLLYIESIPYWETRGYVPTVLRNYWIYEQQAGKVSASRRALAEGKWPRFPGLSGATAVRLEQPPQSFGRGTD